MTAALVAMAVWSFPVLAGVGLAAAGRRAAAAPAVTLGACVALIAFAWPWLRVLPGYSMARHPLVWSWLGPFFLAWLVALGTDGLTGDAGRGRAARLLAGLFGAALVVQLPLAGLLLGRSLVGAVGMSWTPYVAPRRRARAGRRRHGRARGGGARRRLPRPRRARPATAARGARRRAPRRVRRSPRFRSARRCRRSRHPTRRTASRRSSAASPARKTAAFSASPTSRAAGSSASASRICSAPSTASCLRASRGSWTDSASTSCSAVDWNALARAEGFVDALDVGLVVAPQRVTEEFAAHGLDRTGGTAAHLALYANRDRGARAQVVYAATVLPALDAALTRVLAPGFDPRREVVLEQSPAGRYPPRARQPPLARDGAPRGTDARRGDDRRGGARPARPRRTRASPAGRRRSTARRRRSSARTSSRARWRSSRAPRRPLRVPRAGAGGRHRGHGRCARLLRPLLAPGACPVAGG